jgi:regulator of protease activity HflC (stomatin/prohibitin superfamily)
MLASTIDIIGIAAVVALGGAGLAAWFVSRCVKIVQQGSVGVVKRFGEFRSVDSRDCACCARSSTKWRRSICVSSP